jgi:hypothetical protein
MRIKINAPDFRLCEEPIRGKLLFQDSECIVSGIEVVKLGNYLPLE